MDEIKWLEVAVNTTPDRLDEVTAKLTAAGMTGLVIEDEGEFQQFLEQNRQYWDYVDQELMDRMRGVTRVKFYVTDDGAGRVQLEQYTRPGRGVHRHPPDGQRLGVQLAEVL